MLFNSLNFLIFFPTVCFIYYLIPWLKLRNLFLLVASYYFYMNWNPVYSLLLLSATLITYFGGMIIGRIQKENNKKTILTISLILTFSLLFVFKYYNFINQSIFNVLDYFHIRWSVPNLHLLLPIGISFYTFQAAGYMIDVYRKKVPAEHNLFTYALFIAFFPITCAGPIERAKNLLPQLKNLHPLMFDNVVSGFKLMLWGYFMKLCIADRGAIYVDTIYNSDVATRSGLTLLLTAFIFTIQIYCDFAGYSLIAIGAGKTMGFSLMENFRRPYLTRSFKDFWKRWHISLSSWFGEYVYIPLGGNRVPYGRHLFNLMVTFLVSGIWHGADWTFLCWGGVHGIYLILENIVNRFVFKNQKVEFKNKLLVFIHTCFKIVFCFVFVMFAWIFFRAKDFSQAFIIFQKIFTDWSGGLFIDDASIAYFTICLMLLFIRDIKDEFCPNHHFFLNSRYLLVRYFAMVFLLAIIFLCGVLGNDQFIYFQF